MRTWWCTSATTPSRCDVTILGTSSTRYPAGRLKGQLLGKCVSKRAYARAPGKHTNSCPNFSVM